MKEAESRILEGGRVFFGKVFADDLCHFRVGFQVVHPRHGIAQDFRELPAQHPADDEKGPS